MDLTELIDVAEAQRAAQKTIRVHCCTSTGCRAANALEVFKNLKTAVADEALGETVEVVGVGCMGFCGRGPLVQIDPDDALYEEVKPEEAASIIGSLKGGTATALKGDVQHPFFRGNT